MPNHIQNRLQFKGDKKQVNKVLTAIATSGGGGNKDEDAQIDFNKIVPMPEGLSIEAHLGIIQWAEICTCKINFEPLFQLPKDSLSNMFKNQQYGSISDRLKASTALESIMGKRRSVKDFDDKEFEMFIQCLQNVRKHGFFTWYEWAIQNWGTKWNAYGQNDERNTEDTIFFQTAWSSPIALIGKLSAMFPTVEMVLTYADEDSGSNAGVITFKNGEPTKVNQPESQSIAAYDLYFELHPDRKDEYRLVGNTYEYKDEE